MVRVYASHQFGLGSILARSHMWVEFVVDSHPRSEDFSPGTSVFLPPQKPTLLNSNSIWNLRATGLSDVRLLSVTLVKQSRFILFYFKEVLPPGHYMYHGCIFFQITHHSEHHRHHPVTWYFLKTVKNVPLTY